MKVVEAILESMVVFGYGLHLPRSFPNLMIDEIGKCISETKAQVAYVCLSWPKEERRPSILRDGDHVAVLHKHLGRNLSIPSLSISIRFHSLMNSWADDDNWLMSTEFQRLHSQVPQVISSDFLKLVNGGAHSWWSESEEDDADHAVKMILRFV